MSESKISVSAFILKIFRDQIWQFVGTVLSALAIFATYHVLFLQQDVKALQVVVLSKVSLVEVENSIAEQVDVLYNNQTISSLYMFDIKVENIGHQAIREEDIINPVRFVFPSEAKVVEAFVLDSFPKNIGLTVEMEQNEVTLSPGLLNKHDRVIVRVFVGNVPRFDDEQLVHLDGRIIGVEQISFSNAINERDSSSEMISFGAFVLGIISSVAVGFVMAGVLGVLLQKRRLARVKMMMAQRSLGRDESNREDDLSDIDE